MINASWAIPFQTEISVSFQYMYARTILSQLHQHAWSSNNPRPELNNQGFYKMLEETILYLCF
jgi:hypothetical protein